MKTNEIRTMWLNFFAKKGHQVIESAPLIPIDDDTLLWINAGIAPLKKYFDGTQIPQNKRLVSAQKCIRTNDIENVGVTSRHHTLFEMLGNFSIGDYFRDDALTWALEFLTGEEYLNLDLSRLYFTYYPSDIKTRDKWLSLGVEQSHLIPLAGNYWEIGEGPCGPDTEIFYDRGEAFDERGIELLVEDIDNERFVEIWNIVFSQYNSQKGLKREEYAELPSKNIDTGMGLERVASILQDVDTNYETDGFMPIIEKIAQNANEKYHMQASYRIIADHLKCVVFALSDGAVLSNEGRGYVLRRLLRRASRYGRILGFNNAFMYKIVKTIVEINDYYPALKNHREMIEKIIKLEEEKFLLTLEKGEKLLKLFIEDQSELSGEKAFMLYDTYGFPIELTVEISEELGVKVDLEGFYHELEEQKKRSQASRNVTSSLSTQNEELLNFTLTSKFIGYEELRCDSQIIAIIKDGKIVESAKGMMEIVFDKTPFYAISGGQVSDSGKITINNITYDVLDVVKLPHDQHAHIINTAEVITKGAALLEVDEKTRRSITLNHSATHLLHFAIKQVVGEHSTQQGSYVDSDYLRFDFNHFESISNEMLIEIENYVNDLITKGLTAKILELPLEEAKKLGANALFGEKYGDIVRVVMFGESKEFCGGCHIENTSEIKKFAILSCESKGSGIYRITATTKDYVHIKLLKSLEKQYEQFREQKMESHERFTKLQKLGEKNKVLEAMVAPILDSQSQLKELFENIDILFDDLDSYAKKNSLNNRIAQLQKLVYKQKKAEEEVLKQANLNSVDFTDKVVEINGLRTVLDSVTLDDKMFRALVDKSLHELKLDFIFLINSSEKTSFIAKANDIATVKGIHCGNIVREVATLVDGRGGGKASFAQGGATSVTNIDDIFSKITVIIEKL